MKINFSEIILSLGPILTFAFIIWGGDNDSRQLILLSICLYINFRKRYYEQKPYVYKVGRSYDRKTIIKNKVFLMPPMGSF